MNRHLLNLIDLPVKFPNRRSQALIVLCVLFMIVAAQQRLWAQKTGPCSSLDLNFDDKDDVHAKDKYAAAIQKLLEQEKFDELECTADSDRSTKATFSGGYWKLRAFYAGTEAPRGHATEEDWSTHLQRLNRWIAARPSSITARVSLANAYVQYAWAARGEDFANKVTESGSRLFSQRMEKGRQALDQASSLQAKCPEWYFAMQDVAQGEGWDRAKIESLLNQAVAFEPNYYYYYRAHAALLSPSWYGDDGDPEKFIQQAADRIGGSKGDILYFRVAPYMVHRVPGIKAERLSWPRIQKGFAAVEKQDGVSLTNLNWLAYMAGHAHDAIVADDTFTRIGDSWAQEVWGTKDNFDSSKTGAANFAPMAKWQKEADNAVEADMQTEEGHYLAKQFQIKYADAIQECTHSGASQSAMLDLTVCVMQDGNFSWIFDNARPNKDFSACLINKVHGRPIAPPPYVPYWIKVESKPAPAAAAPAR